MLKLLRQKRNKRPLSNGSAKLCFCFGVKNDLSMRYEPGIKWQQQRKHNHATTRFTPRTGCAGIVRDL